MIFPKSIEMPVKACQSFLAGFWLFIAIIILNGPKVSSTVTTTPSLVKRKG
jgi:hypothetical protein